MIPRSAQHCVNRAVDASRPGQEWNDHGETIAYVPPSLHQALEITGTRATAPQRFSAHVAGTPGSVQHTVDCITQLGRHELPINQHIGRQKSWQRI